jgi:hypothetical protein
VVVSSKGKKTRKNKIKQNHTKQNKQPTKCPKFKCSRVSVSFSACRCSSVVFSSRVGREKKKCLETVLRMVSVAVVHLPAAVSLLLLAALSMQISGVSLALTWPRRLRLLRVLRCSSLCYKLSPFQALGKVTLHPLSQACVFVYSSRGKWVFPPLLWGFPPSATPTSFPAPGCWAQAPAPALPSQARLVYLQFHEGFLSPLFGVQGTPSSLLRVFFVVIAYHSVSLFSLGGGRSVQGAMLIWPRVVCGSSA